jgi:hypothetical protein
MSNIKLFESKQIRTVWNEVDNASVKKYDLPEVAKNKELK